ncbi:hypothetical protein WAF17_21990 [Bernardetia sp. ABR2-2B]|uniref:hypothetical protein n=1 Tax=Bernardetia sp. ABR2-2B TaxID=3127472 RepID=UPI0030D1A57C
MLKKIFNNRKNQKWIFSSLLLVSIGLYFFGVLDPNQVILSVASEGTPPTRFDIAFGTFKINQKMPDSLKDIDYNDCCVDAINENNFYEGGEFAYSDIYVVTFDINSVDIRKSQGFYHLLIKVISHKKIDIFFVQSYFILLLIVIGNTIYIIWDFTKKGE